MRIRNLTAQNYIPHAREIGRLLKSRIQYEQVKSFEQHPLLMTQWSNAWTQGHIPKRSVPCNSLLAAYLGVW